MDIHGDNSFKAKSYSSAAFTIDKLTTQLSTLQQKDIYSVKGIGESIGRAIVELLETGSFSVLNDYLQKTPPGILEMLNIKGIGPKKIATIWKELEIETLGELLYACNENRLTLYKGFGEKTQKNIKESIEFYMGTLGSYLYQQVEVFAESVDQQLQKHFNTRFLLTGEFRRQLEIINQIEWVTDTPASLLKEFFNALDFETSSEDKAVIRFKGKENITLCFYLVDSSQLYSTLFKTSCSPEFLSAWNEETKWNEAVAYRSEEDIFTQLNMGFIPAFRRETAESLQTDKHNKSIPSYISTADITGIIHSHSNWSDGSNTIEEMADAAISNNLQFLVISDHSKSAFYANGLQEDRIRAQHQQIDTLNASKGPFKIFKSIESDILNDGSLDYPEYLLKEFDLIIASVHSNLKMNEDKAMSRLIKAIENPYTSILGHMTGRLLLSRNGYPVDHHKIIDACKANQVVIELNAHPRRLDMDWRWIHEAIEKNVLISINPDAHSIDGYKDCKYGILVAQKAGLTKENNLSSFSLEAFDQFVTQQKAKRPV